MRAMGVEMTGKDETPPGGGGMMGQTPWRHPRGGGYDGTNTTAASPGRGGGDGTNTLVQPHYPTPTKSVNPAGGRGGRARKGQQSRGNTWGG